MRLKEFVSKQLKVKKTAGPKSDVVLSSRVRLVRNISSKVFPWRASSSVLEEIWEEMKEVAVKTHIFSDSECFYLPDLMPVDKQLLIERHLISFNHATQDWPRGIIMNGTGDLSVMVNEEDHIRLASIENGLNLIECAKTIDEIDNRLSHEIEYAFSEQWGFLTACPTNAGTGMRASCLVHLPALIIRDKIEPMLSELSKLGIVVRGFYGEGTKVVGDIFQITNGTTLGHTETEILQNIEHVVNGVIGYEKAARNELLNAGFKSFTEDKIFRAAAVLGSARKIDFQEAMEMISMVKLGIGLGLDLKWKEEVLNELMEIIQPAHIQEIEGRIMTADERDCVRANIIRTTGLSGKD